MVCTPKRGRGRGCLELNRVPIRGRQTVIDTLIQEAQIAEQEGRAADAPLFERALIR
jgi:hypothetical protein